MRSGCGPLAGWEFICRQIGRRSLKNPSQPLDWPNWKQPHELWFTGKEDYWLPLARALQAEMDARAGVKNQPDNINLKTPEPVNIPVNTPPVLTANSSLLTPPVNTPVNSPKDRKSYMRDYMRQRRAKELTTPSSLAILYLFPISHSAAHKPTPIAPHTPRGGPNPLNHHKPHRNPPLGHPTIGPPRMCCLHC
jgi:hypothetical protein